MYSFEINEKQTLDTTGRRRDEQGALLSERLKVALNNTAGVQKWSNLCDVIYEQPLKWLYSEKQNTRSWKIGRENIKLENVLTVIFLFKDHLSFELQICVTSFVLRTAIHYFLGISLSLVFSVSSSSM